MRAPSLKSRINQSFIVAYKEDTTELQQALGQEGFSPRVLRPEYTATELTYSRTIRCLLNHASAWRLASAATGLSLIVEADFVPCEGFGALPLPFDPDRHGPGAWAFLYAGGPRLLRAFPDGFLQGHAACPVACVISPQVGAWLADYARDELQRQPDLTAYSLWDTQFQWRMMGHGAVCFMPFRQYGEHGGLPNPEHHRAGVGVAKRFKLLSAFGVGRNHHADVLWAPLKFLPAYARGSRGRFWRTRCEAKLLGWLKLLTGRCVMILWPLSLRERLRLYSAGARRLCSRY
ncbi:MAG TPA: hypothetical protein VG710_04255 [Opitutus sp.]|nr:hypothetical protein [Opitutus sp.]